MVQPAKQRQGDFLQEDYFGNIGGLNLTDSPFAIDPHQASGGQNFEYTRTGGIKKSLAPTQINSTPQTERRTRGIGQLLTKTSTKSTIRMADTQFQSVNLTSGTFSTLSEDTASAGTSFFSGSSPTSSRMFTTADSDVLWTAGGGLSTLYGAYSSSKVTANGVAAPAGSITATPTGSGSGWTAATGTYFYAVAFRKASTQALSNAALDVSATVGATTDTVEVSLSSISNVDTTKYDQIYIYRSSVAGSSAFTAGDLIAQVSSSATSYSDTGTFIATSQNVPRAANANLDNSVLPSGTFETLAVWKRRLVTANGTRLYYSDLNKPESWPTTNFLDIPSGGKITALGVIGYNHPGSGTTDEFLVVFKDTECWLVTGDTSVDIALKYTDRTGCPQQNLVVEANGFIGWLDARGVYLWDGSGKPVYASRPVEAMFESGTGEIDKSQLANGWGVFLRKKNHMLWFLSSTTDGQQKLQLKLDLRFTLPKISNFLGEKLVESVFLKGISSNGMYGGAAFVDSTVLGAVDNLIMGDLAGYVYRAFDITTGSGDDVDFQYDTAYLDQGSRGKAKRYHKIIVWVDNVGNWNLTMDYWTDYRVRDDERSTISLPISSAADAALPIWDTGEWDTAIWDDLVPTVVPLTFNLNNAEGNMEGDAIKLRFSNANTGEPITINSFSIVYSEIGLRK